MKKAMLYISLIMSAVYAVAVCLVVALQETIRSAAGMSEEMEMDFLIPVWDLFICLIVLVAAIAFGVLLLRAAERMQMNVETAAVIVLSILIVLMPWIFGLGYVVQFRYYGYSIGAYGAAAYSLIHQGITGCNPLLVFAMLLQIIHAGISLGKKGR